jgi:hypothetical protein
MALKISKNAGLTDVVTDVNPITTTHPTTGSASAATQLWLFNDDATKTYQSINIDPTDAVTTDESTWVQLAPDSGGSAGTFGAAGAALSMANVTDNGVGKPFWYKCTTPSGQSVSNKTDIKLTVNYTEYPA